MAYKIFNNKIFNIDKLSKIKNILKTNELQCYNNKLLLNNLSFNELFSTTIKFNNYVQITNMNLPKLKTLKCENNDIIIIKDIIAPNLTELICENNTITIFQNFYAPKFEIIYNKNH